MKLFKIGAEPFARSEQAERGFLSEDLERGLVEGGRDDAFEEGLREHRRRRLVDLAVQGDDPAKCACRIGFTRKAIRLGERIGARDAAGVRMLYDDGRGLRELAHGVERRVDVDEIIEAELFTARAKALGEREAPALCAALNIERSGLMRVLAITHIVGLLEAEREGRGEARGRTVLLREGARARHISSDRAVISRRMAERLRREALARLKRRLALRAELLKHKLIIVGRGHDRHALMRFRSAPHHRRPADIDIFDGLFSPCPARDRRLKRIEVHTNEIDRRSANALESRAIVFAIAHQDAAVDARMERLHAAVHDLRRAREIAHIAHLKPSLSERFRRPARAEDLNAELRKPRREIDDSSFIRDRDQRSFHFLRLSFSVARSIVARSLCRASYRRTFMAARPTPMTRGGAARPYHTRGRSAADHANRPMVPRGNSAGSPSSASPAANSRVAPRD